MMLENGRHGIIVKIEKTIGINEQMKNIIKDLECYNF